MFEFITQTDILLLTMTVAILLVLSWILLIFSTTHSLKCYNSLRGKDKIVDCRGACHISEYDGVVVKSCIHRKVPNHCHSAPDDHIKYCKADLCNSNLTCTPV